MAFKYRPRNTTQWDESSTIASDYQGFLKDEFRLYTPRKGDNAIRIMPPTWDDADHFGLLIYVHYRVGPTHASVLCPFRMKQERCPLCEDVVAAERRHDEDLANELKSTSRILIWMLDRKDEDQGVIAWGLPITVNRDIVKVSKDRTTGAYYNIDDPDQGYDIYFDREGDQMTTKYNGVQLARRATSVDQRYLDYIVENPLPDILQWRDYDEIKALYEGPTAETPAQQKDDRQRPEPTTRNGEDRSPTQTQERRPAAAPTQRVQIQRRPVQSPPATPEEAKLSKSPPTRQPEPTPTAAISGASRAAALRERFLNKK